MEYQDLLDRMQWREFEMADGGPGVGDEENAAIASAITVVFGTRKREKRIKRVRGDVGGQYGACAGGVECGCCWDGVGLSTEVG
jgi:hypothetical protein